MKKRWIFVIAFVGFCFCTAAFIFSHEQILGIHSPIAEQKAKWFRKSILAEINTLGNHEWAGEYYWGDGLGANVSLLIAPKSGYLFEWHGCLGLYDRNYGKVTFKDGKIQLSFTFKEKRFKGTPEELIPIPWGERKYVIPTNEMIEFCNAVNSKSEPRDDIYGMHLLRCGDQEKLVTGEPDIPQAYEKYLLKNPIRAEIISVGEPQIHSKSKVCQITKIPATLNIGQESGLLPGMEMYIIEPNDLISSFIIEKVDNKQSTAILTKGLEDAKPQAGWKLSTLPRWRN